MARHFEYLSKATAEGQLILAGRTMEARSETFGIVIFEAKDLLAATQFMKDAGCCGRNNVRDASPVWRGIAA